MSSSEDLLSLKVPGKGHVVPPPHNHSSCAFVRIFNAAGKLIRTVDTRKKKRGKNSRHPWVRISEGRDTSGRSTKWKEKKKCWKKRPIK